MGNRTGCLVFLGILFQLSAPISADGLESFVRNKMSEYHVWIIENNLDPSVPMNRSFKIHAESIITNLDSEISNMVVQGFGNPNEITWWRFDLPGGYFTIDFDTKSNHLFSGLHKTNGSILSTPITAEGHWTVSASSVYCVEFSIYFKVGSSGFLDVTDTRFRSVVPDEQADVYFEGVTDSDAAQGYEEFVKGSLFNGFKNFLSYGYTHDATHDAFVSTFTQYWTDVLANTTLADIIGATDPPPTYPTTTTEDIPTTISSSTTEGVPTEEPCIRILGDSQHSFISKQGYEIFEEEILETRKSVDGDGLPIVIRRTVVTTKEKLEL